MKKLVLTLSIFVLVLIALSLSSCATADSQSITAKPITLLEGRYIPECYPRVPGVLTVDGRYVSECYPRIPRVLPHDVLSGLGFYVQNGKIYLPSTNFLLLVPRKEQGLIEADYEINQEKLKIIGDFLIDFPNPGNYSGVHTFIVEYFGSFSENTMIINSAKWTWIKQEGNKFIGSQTFDFNGLQYSLVSTDTLESRIDELNELTFAVEITDKSSETIFQTNGGYQLKFDAKKDKMFPELSTENKLIFDNGREVVEVHIPILYFNLLEENPHLHGSTGDGELYFDLDLIPYNNVNALGHLYYWFWGRTYPEYQNVRFDGNIYNILSE